MTLVAVEFIEGQLSPVQKYDMEMYMRFIINYSLDLYRYAYGRGVLLNLSPMSFGINLLSIIDLCRMEVSIPFFLM